MGSQKFPDGLEALHAELKLSEVMRWIERTARWVDAATFRLLPLWYPEYARGAPFYKANWSEPQMNKSRLTGDAAHKREANIYASKALTHALGLRSGNRPNWSCCHIWGVDDALYQESNAVVQDRMFFSCVANMVLLPTPLKAFTDSLPDVKAMLRICARNYYGWTCDHAKVVDSVSVIDAWDSWDAYPASWPRSPNASSPLGVMPLDGGIRESAKRRLERIRRDLATAGKHYPRDEVRAALDYWKIPV